MSATTINLDHPFEFQGGQVTSLTLRRPKARDLKRLSDPRGGSDAERMFRLVSDLAEVPPDLVDELDSKDFERITDHLETVLPKPKASDSFGR